MQNIDKNRFLPILCFALLCLLASHCREGGGSNGDSKNNGDNGNNEGNENNEDEETVAAAIPHIRVGNPQDSLQGVRIVEETNCQADFLLAHASVPLGRIATFSTETPQRIQVAVMGESPIVTNFPEYNRTHSIPIFGLYLNRNNEIEITAIDREGNGYRQNCNIKIELAEKEAEFKEKIDIISNDLRDDFPLLFLLSHAEFGGSENGSRIIDIDGNVRWYWHGDRVNELVIFGISDDNMLLGKLEFNGIFGKINLMGGIELLAEEKSGSPHHFVSAINETTWVALFEEPLQLVREIDAKTGKVIKTYHLQDIVLDPENLRSFRVVDWIARKDPLHSNSVVYDPRDNSLIVSLKNQHAVVKFSRETGEIKWILGSHRGWISPWREKLLTPLFSPTEADYEDDPLWTYSQHSATLMPNGNILVFDNGGGRPRRAGVPYFNNRVVEYKINEEKRTVAIEWDYRPDKNYGRFYRGSVHYIPQIDGYLILFPFYGVRNHAAMHLVNRDDELLYEVQFPGTVSNFYHVLPLGNWEPFEPVSQ